jgi:hypothetical protein
MSILPIKYLFDFPFGCQYKSGTLICTLLEYKNEFLILYYIYKSTLDFCIRI